MYRRKYFKKYIEKREIYHTAIRIAIIRASESREWSASYKNNCSGNEYVAAEWYWTYKKIYNLKWKYLEEGWGSTPTMKMTKTR